MTRNDFINLTGYVPDVEEFQNVIKPEFDGFVSDKYDFCYYWLQSEYHDNVQIIKNLVDDIVSFVKNGEDPATLIACHNDLVETNEKYAYKMSQLMEDKHHHA